MFLFFNHFSIIFHIFDLMTTSSVSKASASFETCMRMTPAMKFILRCARALSSLLDATSLQHAAYSVPRAFRRMQCAACSVQHAECCGGRACAPLRVAHRGVVLRIRLQHPPQPLLPQGGATRRPAIDAGACPISTG